jgi:SdrD B-like domain
MKLIHVVLGRALLIFLFSGFSFCSEARDNAPSSLLSTASVGDRVWLDRDANGRQDVWEVGFPGIEVQLLDESGVRIATVHTDANGYYSFTDVDAGTTGKTYEVYFKLPDNYQFCRRYGALADGQNSDANELTGRSGPFLLLPGQNNDALDAGVISPALGALPLHTLDLTAELKSGQIKLKWLAENEMNTRRFVIQQSTNGTDFTTINLTGINGIQNIPTYYFYTVDMNMVPGAMVLYFRIRAEDENNRAAYSNIAVVRMERISDVRLWPNPFVHSIQLSYYSITSATLDVRLTDNTGGEKWRGVMEVNKGMNQLVLDGLSRLTTGTYFLQLTDRQTGQTFTGKLIK